MKFESKDNEFHSRMCLWKCRLQNDGHLILAAMYSQLGPEQQTLTRLFKERNTFDNIVCKMAAISVRSQCPSISGYRWLDYQNIMCIVDHGWGMILHLSYMRSGKFGWYVLRYSALCTMNPKNCKGPNCRHWWQQPSAPPGTPLSNMV